MRANIGLEPFRFDSPFPTAKGWMHEAPDGDDCLLIEVQVKKCSLNDPPSFHPRNWTINDGLPTRRKPRGLRRTFERAICLYFHFCLYFTLPHFWLKFPWSLSKWHTLFTPLSLYFYYFQEHSLPLFLNQSLPSTSTWFSLTHTFVFIIHHTYSPIFFHLIPIVLQILRSGFIANPLRLASSFRLTKRLLADSRLLADPPYPP